MNTQICTKNQKRKMEICQDDNFRQKLNTKAMGEVKGDSVELVSPC